MILQNDYYYQNYTGNEKKPVVYLRLQFDTFMLSVDDKYNVEFMF